MGRLSNFTHIVHADSPDGVSERFHQASAQLNDGFLGREVGLASCIGERQEDSRMCQEAVERAIGKLATDESFRTAFTVDPERASLEAGLRLSSSEIVALSRIPALALEQFAKRLDDTICRLPCGPAAVESKR
jgi:hypothetical protein